MLPMGPALTVRPHLESEEWQKMVAYAAYFLAEKRGFEPGAEIDDWLAAEADLAMQLAQRALAGSK